MISIRHLSKTFTNPDGGTISPLKDVNCDIEKGEVISIIGPSGTGKSTLLRAINMLEPPTAGQIIVDGKDVTAGQYPLVIRAPAVKLTASEAAGSGCEKER